MNLLIHNEWQPDNEAMTMTVHVLVTDLVNFKMPRALPEGTKKFGDALKSFINHQAKEIPLSFQFELSKNDFLDLKDIDTVAILTAFGEALTQALMDKSLKNYDQIWDMGMLGLDTIMDIKKLFDKY